MAAKGIPLFKYERSSYREQLSFLLKETELARQRKDIPRLRLLLSLAESVKAAKKHDLDCRVV